MAIEDLKLGNMVRRPAPKPAEDGQSFLPNNAAAKAGLNRSMLDAGIGGLFTMLEAKASERGRIVERINPANTSRTCPSCGTIDKASRVSQAEFRCVSCGHTMNADHNAAVNILRSAWPDAVVPMAPAPLQATRTQLVLLDAGRAQTKRCRCRRVAKAALPSSPEQLALWA